MDDKDTQQKIEELYQIAKNNTSDIQQLSKMIYQQSIAINNLLAAYNQNAINSNNNVSTTNSILRKMSDMEIKNANNDVTFQDILDSISSLKDEISNLFIAIKEIDMYGGGQW